MLASLDWKGMECCSNFLHILQWQSCIFQTRNESLKPCIALNVWWSAKHVFAPNSLIFWRSGGKEEEDGDNRKCKAFCFLSKRKNCTFACVHGRYLLYESFPRGGRQTQQYFNVSSPSSRREKKWNYSKVRWKRSMIVQNKFVTYKLK